MQIEDSGIVRSVGDGGDEQSLQKMFPFRIKETLNTKFINSDRILKQLPFDNFIPDYELKPGFKLEY